MSENKTINYTLIKKIKITGKIKLLTGMAIGGTDTGMEIGGLDKTVVRNPLTGLPYIPGSSLKGKLRSLLELSEGAIMYKKMGKVEHIGSDDSKYITARLFGNSKGDETQRPSRLIVRDCHLDVSSFNGKELDLPYAEAKTEVVIDRITAQAMPRTIERVPAGAVFNMEMILNLFDDNGKKDNEDEYKEAIKKAIKLLHNDYLGGNGSRGYGQVEITYENKEVEI
jgi:CRISPR-associated protein Csm3